MFGFSPEVSLFGVPKIALTHRLDFVANLPVYEGWALSSPTVPQVATIVSVTAAADTNFEVNAHGLTAGMRIEIRDATGEWAALNGVHTVKTVVGPNDFTVEQSSAGFVDPWAGTLSIWAPRTQDAVWSILRRTFDAGGSPILEEWANGNTLAGNIWDDRATLRYQ